MEFDAYNFKGPGVALAMFNVDEVCMFIFFNAYMLFHVNTVHVYMFVYTLDASHDVWHSFD